MAYRAISGRLHNPITSIVAAMRVLLNLRLLFHTLRRLGKTDWQIGRQSSSVDTTF